MTVSDSVRPLSCEDYVEGFEEEDYVQPEVPVSDVPAVEADAFFVVYVAAAADLPHAGDAGADHEVVFFEFAVSGEFFGNDGAGADEAHFAF